MDIFNFYVKGNPEVFRDKFSNSIFRSKHANYGTHKETINKNNFLVREQNLITNGGWDRLRVYGQIVHYVAVNLAICDTIGIFGVSCDCDLGHLFLFFLFLNVWFAEAEFYCQKYVFWHFKKLVPF